MGGKDWVCQKVRGRRGRGGPGTPGWGELCLEACALLWGKNGLLCTLITHMSTSAWLERTAGLVSHQHQGHKTGDGEEQEGILVHKHKNPTCKQNRFDCKMTTIKL